MAGSKIQLPHMPLWVYDIDTDRDCRRMTDAEFGRYMRLMIRQWIEGSVPAMAADAIKDAGLDLDSAESTQDLLNRKFTLMDDSGRRNQRCADERQRVTKKVKTLRKNGRKGGVANAEANASANGNPNGRIHASGSGSKSLNLESLTLDSGLNESQIACAREIESAVNKIPPGSSVNAGTFHRAVEAELRKAGLSVFREYSVNLPDGSVGRIDLVAVRGDDCWAIELDWRRPRSKSLIKLLADDSWLRVIVLREGGKHTPIMAGIDAIVRYFDPSPMQESQAVPFGPEFAAAWSEWCQHRREMGKPVKATAMKQQLSRLVEMGEQRAIDALHYSTANGWQGIFEPDGKTNGRQKPDRSDRTAGHHPEPARPVPTSL